MSTKTTIAHGPKFHVYQEMCEHEAVYVQVEAFTSLKLDNSQVTLALSPKLLDAIAQGWLENRSLFEKDRLELKDEDFTTWLAELDKIKQADK